MKYCGTLIAIEDLDASKRCYAQTPRMKTKADFGANAMLAGICVCSPQISGRDSWSHRRLR